jgi:hypothetical protein
MPRWEYLTIRTEVYGSNGDQIAARSLNGQELRDWKKTPLNWFINQLGADGWEMIGELNGNHLFFKRPKP